MHYSTYDSLIAQAKRDADTPSEFAAMRSEIDAAHDAEECAKEEEIEA